MITTVHESDIVSNAQFDALKEAALQLVSVTDVNLGHLHIGHGEQCAI